METIFAVAALTGLAWVALVTLVVAPPGRSEKGSSLVADGHPKVRRRLLSRSPYDDEKERRERERRKRESDDAKALELERQATALLVATLKPSLAEMDRDGFRFVFADVSVQMATYKAKLESSGLQFTHDSVVCQVDAEANRSKEPWQATYHAWVRDDEGTRRNEKTTTDVSEAAQYFVQKAILNLERGHREKKEYQKLLAVARDRETTRVIRYLAKLFAGSVVLMTLISWLYYISITGGTK